MPTKTIPQKTITRQPLTERLFSWQIAAYRTHPNPVELVECAFEVALETLESHDYGDDHVAARETPRNFISKFESLRGQQAYVFCLSTAWLYGGGDRMVRHD